MPPMSGVLGAVILKEVITLPLVLGAILIFLGVFFAERGPPQRPAPAAEPPLEDYLRRDPCLMC